MWLFWCIYFSYRKINVTGGDANAKVAFKNCAPFEDCRTEINDPFVDYADFINITMPMYNLIEYSDHYSDFMEVYGILKEIK